MRAGSGDLYNLVIDAAGVPTAPVAIVGVLNVAGDLDVTEGIFRVYGGSDTITIDGDVTISDGGTFSSYSAQLGLDGVETILGNLTIEEGGEYSATPLTTTITAANASNYVIENSGTFTHNEGTVLISSSTGYLIVSDYYF